MRSNRAKCVVVGRDDKIRPHVQLLITPGPLDRTFSAYVLVYEVTGRIAA